MAMPAPTYYTADMVRAFPDDRNKYEVVRGELLVSAAPRPWHEVVVLRLLRSLDEYLDAQQVGCVFGSRSDISWGPDVLVQPDVFVALLEEARALEWSQIQRLLLVAEVLSPSSLKADRFTKRIEYQRQRIPLYWIVDADRREVEVWLPEERFPTTERERLVWHPAGATEPFILTLERLFRPILAH